MAKYTILKTFRGSQDGINDREYVKGEVAEINDYLADIALPEGWIKPVSPADDRETKVVEPDETKGDEETTESDDTDEGGEAPDMESMTKPELVKYGATLGLELNVKDKKDDLIAAILGVSVEGGE